MGHELKDWTSFERLEKLSKVRHFVQNVVN